MTKLDYKPLYLHLFNKVTDAVEMLKGVNGRANTPAVQRVIDVLCKAQCEAEEMYMDFNEIEDASRPKRDGRISRG